MTEEKLRTLNFEMFDAGWQRSHRELVSEINHIFMTTHPNQLTQEIAKWLKKERNLKYIKCSKIKGGVASEEDCQRCGYCEQLYKKIMEID